LSVCVMAGYPGTIASTWQQAGRAGRRAGLSVAVLVASALPLDQYLVTHPRYFFGRPVEQALLDPDNLAVLANHLACAAFELPFEAGEPFGDFEDAGAVLDMLAQEGALHRSDGRYTWIGEGYPAGRLSLRTSTPNNIVIQDVSADLSTGRDAPRVIGQMDRPSAPTLIHEGAVYLHGGATYVVESLDWEEGLARVRAAELDYYTRASATTDVRVLDVLRSGEGTTAARACGELLVTTRATGYRRIKRYTHEVLAWAPIDLPEQEWRTIGYWLVLSEGLTARLQDAGVLVPPVDYGPNWSVQRDAARARDGYHCVHCGASEREGRRHDVHHITPFRAFGYVRGANDMYKLANQLENLITLCPACHRRVERTRGAHGALAGLAYLLQNLAPLYLMCDPGDLGAVVQARAPETGLPTVTLYDRTPGGAGLSVRLYELHDDLLEAALDVVRRCPCADGCPGCVGPAGDAGSGVKRLTCQLLEAVVERPGPGEGITPSPG
jgi:DEAD/DEAH box helicase domain-containing protein